MSLLQACFSEPWCRWCDQDSLEKDKETESGRDINHTADWMPPYQTVIIVVALHREKLFKTAKRNKKSISYVLVFLQYDDQFLNLSGFLFAFSALWLPLCLHPWAAPPDTYSPLQRPKHVKSGGITGNLWESWGEKWPAGKCETKCQKKKLKKIFEFPLMSYKFLSEGNRLFTIAFIEW